MTSALSRTFGYAVTASGVVFAAQNIFVFAAPPKNAKGDVHSRALIVDAGSGFSRSYTFRTKVSDGLPTMVKQARLPGANLVQVIKEGKGEEFVEQLEQLRAEEEADRDSIIEPENKGGWFGWLSGETAAPTSSVNGIRDKDKKRVPVIVGATAGVRKALESEEITQESVTAFTRGLEARGMQFQLLTGQREAELELQAARFCFGHLMPQIAARIGIFSGGGMSAQVVSGTRAHSLAFELKTQNKKLAHAANTSHGALKRQIERDIPAHFQRCVNAAKARSGCAQDQTLGESGSVFVALEMMAWVGELVGMGDGKRLVPAPEAKSRLSAFVRGCQETIFRTSRESKREKNYWKVFVPMVTALEALAILEMLDPDCLVFFQSQYSVGTTKLKPTWGLALYLQEVANMDDQS